MKLNKHQILYKFVYISGPSEININHTTLRLGRQIHLQTEPVFLNVYGAQVSIPRNEFRQPPVCSLAGRTITHPIPSRFLVPIDCLKIPAQGDGGMDGARLAQNTEIVATSL